MWLYFVLGTINEGNNKVTEKQKKDVAFVKPNLTNKQIKIKDRKYALKH